VTERFDVVSRGSYRKDFEVIERKGIGHPDTMSDELAVRLSRRYSKYTRENYDAILHHNFDKVGLLGGMSSVSLGNGELTAPIRVLLNGRASDRFGNESIPLREILIETTQEFLGERLPIDPISDLDIRYNVSTASSPGGVKDEFDEENPRDYWFKPRDLDDLPERKELVSNDTSHGTGYAPLSPTEQFVRDLEEFLTGEYRDNNDWIGTDVKLMATQDGDTVNLTGAIPHIADETPDVESYKLHLDHIRSVIEEFAAKSIPERELDLHLNTRTNYETGQMYLTAIGSAIESGDEGLVGRGNRTNGLITPSKPMSIEGQCGKNPVYHVGMLYNIAARRVSKSVHDVTNSYVESHLVSQSGRQLTDPWIVRVNVYDEGFDREEVEDAIATELEAIPQITDEWLAGDVRLY